MIAWSCLAQSGTLFEGICNEVVRALETLFEGICNEVVRALETLFEGNCNEVVGRSGCVGNPF